MTQTARPTPALGLRGKLFLSFGSVAAMAVAGALVGWVALDRVAGTQAAILEVEVPNMADAQQLAAISARIAAGAPVLAAAASPAESRSAAAELTARTEELKAALAGLESRGVDAAAIRTTVDGLAGNLAKLGGLVEQRLALAEQRRKAREGGNELATTLVGSIEPIVEDASNKVFDTGTALANSATDGLNAVAAAGAEAATAAKAADDKVQALVGQLLDEDYETVQGLLQVRLALSQLSGLLNDAATMTTEEDKNRLEPRWFQSADRLLVNLGKIPDEAARLAYGKQAAQLVEYGRGDKGLFNVRVAELKAEAGIQAVLAESRGQADALVGAVGGLVGAAKTGMANAAVAADQSVGFGRNLLIAIAVASLIAAGAIAWFYVGGSIVARLKALEAAMLRLADGDLSVAIPSGGKDEIAAMAATLTVFRQKSQEAADAEARTTAERERAAAERRQAMLSLANSFERSVKEMTDSLTKAAHSMHNAADGMVGTASETRGQSSAAAEAATAASSSVSTVAAAAEELSASIREISRQVSLSTRIAGQAVHDAERTNATVISLATAAEKITEVVGLIQAIAAQTNLLALNATIEAARAGEAGKGFAVVANEVKSLANQTAKATEDISSQISAIQAATREAVTAIGGIGQTIGQVNEIATAIAAAVEEQGAATEEISRSVQDAARSTGKLSANIGTVSRVAGETGRSAELVLNAAGEMTRQMDSLHEQVDGFLAEVRAG
ncbi:MAG TPA: methyl-accepting chemotaxis protein [Alphaproteobacteria bacterium]|nr:methyl-accepting chemotaxis protein [Alphaproteobacteria bacterium]